MSQHVNESLSALMDDEASELEVRRILKEVAEDEALLRQWQRYHAVRDVMHDSASRLPSRDLLSGIQSALADEPAHAVKAAAAASWYQRMSRPLAQGSIAATVAFAVLFSVHTLRSPDAPAGATPGVQPGSVQLSANTNSRYVEGEFNRTVSFSNERRELDPQTLERLREAIYREFEHYSLAPQLPSLQVDSAQD